MTLRSYPLAERLRAVLWWLPLYLAVALTATFLQPPVPLHSTRALAVAWDMWAHHQFLVPHINGAPYAQKAPLLFWLIHAGWAVFGVTDAWPRILMVLIGAVQMVLAQALARRLFPDNAWIARATPWLLLAFAYGFLYGLQIMYDGLLAIWVLGAMLCLVPDRHRLAPRWIGFALCLGLGLLTKGPVMLVHVLPVWLLGPWWSSWARGHRRRWYGWGSVATLAGAAILAAWVIPATLASGGAYTHDLVYKQTGGRVVNAFIHERPAWWYLPWVPVLLFPFTLWPRMWAALIRMRRPLAPGFRMLLAWLASAFLVFTAFSGKQSYYLVPELGAAAILVAAAITHLRERSGNWSRSRWLGAWPLALAWFALGGLLLALPWLAASGHLDGHWLRDAAATSAPFGLLYLLLGLLVLPVRRGELRRIATSGLIGTAAAYALFALAYYPAFDLRPAAQVLATAEAHGHAVGNLGLYDGQFAFAGRMTHPVQRLYEGQSLQDFATRHPHGLVLDYPDRLTPAMLRYARLVQPYRGAWLVIWDAPIVAALRRGQQPADPAAPTVLLPKPSYWRYADVPG